MPKSLLTCTRDLISFIQEAVFDPDNIDWAEPISLSDEEVDVKEVENRSRRILSSRRPAFGQADNSQYDDLVSHLSSLGSLSQLISCLVTEALRFMERNAAR